MGMWQWQRHRSAPAGALFVAATALASAVACGVVLAVATVRAARGLPSATVGLPRGSFERPRFARSAYDGALFAFVERETPRGTPAAAHRWRVFDRRSPDEPLCAGVAEDALALAPLGTLATDAPAHRMLLRLALPEAVFTAGEPVTVPPRLFATCAALSQARAEGTPAEQLAYAEEIVPAGTALHVAACARPLDEIAGASQFAPDASFVLANCPDATPGRVYPRDVPVAARARLRTVVARASWGAVLFSLACTVVGLFALRRGSRASA